MLTNRPVDVGLKNIKSEGWIISHKVLLKDRVTKIYCIIMVIQFFVGIINKKNWNLCRKNDAGGKFCWTCITLINRYIHILLTVIFNFDSYSFQGGTTLREVGYVLNQQIKSERPKNTIYTMMQKQNGHKFDLNVRVMCVFTESCGKFY